MAIAKSTDSLLQRLEDINGDIGRMSEDEFERWRDHMRALGDSAPHAKNSADWMQRIYPAMRDKGYWMPDPYDPVHLARERSIWRALKRVPYWRGKGHDEEKALRLAVAESNDFWDEDLLVCGYVGSFDEAPA